MKKRTEPTIIDPHQRIEPVHGQEVWDPVSRRPMY
jgi:hypothetical protein